MKYWEIVKRLTENPELSGVAVIDSTRYELYVDDSGTLESKTYYLKLGTMGYSIGAAGNIDFDGWEIFKQPVTWQEAIQAWNAGKVVKVRTTHWDYVFSPIEKMELLPTMIQDGTWHVED